MEFATFSRGGVAEVTVFFKNPSVRLWTGDVLTHILYSGGCLAGCWVLSVAQISGIDLSDLK